MQPVLTGWLPGVRNLVVKERLSNDGMEYEETYYGQQIVITTIQKGGGWAVQVDLLDSGKRTPLWGDTDRIYPTEDDARGAARSAAAAAIDRARTSKGKP